MDKRKYFDILSTFTQLKKYKPGLLEFEARDIEIKKYRATLNQLLNIRVSKRSIFCDMVWDFNHENPNVVANVRGSKLRIDFQKYKSLPTGILIEIKCIFLNTLLNPSVFFNNRKKTRKKTTISLAPNTVIAHIKAGLRFLETLFKQQIKKLGQEYIEKKYNSLTCIQVNDYHEAAKAHSNNYNDDLRQFFSYLQNPFTSEFVFDESLPALDADQFDWAKVYKKKESAKIISNMVFDKLVRTASLIVHNFLITMGEDVQDQKVKKYSCQASTNYCKNIGLSQKFFNLYRAYRLLIAGYDENFITTKYGSPLELVNPCGNYHESSMSKYLNSSIPSPFTLFDIKAHLNLVSNSAKYLIGQFTGMRPSELSMIEAKNCLSEENGVKLLCSKVSKGRNTLSNGIFDDKWVAIPIIEDSVNAIIILNTITQREFLFSSTVTKKINIEEKPQSSLTIKNSIVSLIKHTYPKTKINFNNYMMRHTLAYQLYRVEAGLPLISFQLKHLVNTVEKFLSRGSSSDVTLGYGGIAEILVESQTAHKLRRQSEVEVIKATADPDGNYLGGKANEHKERLNIAFKGYMASGYTKEDIYEAMADQGLGVINVGLGYCYGSDNTNESLPCIGSLKCNPNRCSNAIVSKANAPYWQEIYNINLANLDKPAFRDNKEQIQETINEAKLVLISLGYEVDDE